MRRTTSARIAGFTFLFYIAVAFPAMVLMNRATRGDGVAARLSQVVEHALDLRVAILLTLLSCFSAVVLAVTLYGITREVDQELAVFVLACRLGEGVVGVIGIPNALGLLWLARGGASDFATTQALGTYLLMPAQEAMIGAPFFALGSLAFSYLLLRGRLVPRGLAWLGLVASALLAVVLPLQLSGFLHGPLTGLVWLPMLAFEVPLGAWLLLKGTAAPPQP